MSLFLQCLPVVDRIRKSWNDNLGWQVRWMIASAPEPQPRKKKEKSHVRQTAARRK